MQFQTTLIHIRTGATTAVADIVETLHLPLIDSTDIWQFDPGETASIGIQTAHDLNSWLALRPYASTAKLAILHQAEKLTIEAQNALLKTMEEPANDAQLVLISAEPLKLLPTVLSRSRLVRFRGAAATEQSVTEAIAAWNTADYLAKLKLIQDWLGKNKRNWFSNFIVGLWQQLIEESRELANISDLPISNKQEKLQILQQLYIGIGHNANLQPALETLALCW